MAIRLEHVNMIVRNIDGMIDFIQAAFPDFRIRQDNVGDDGLRWVHCGNDHTYIALNQATKTPHEDWKPYCGVPGINHFGFEVDDVDAIHDRLSRRGYKNSTVPNLHPARKRVYFFDPEGNDWEFVEYLSDAVEQRNDYDLPDR